MLTLFIEEGKRKKERKKERADLWESRKWTQKGDFITFT